MTMHGPQYLEERRKGIGGSDIAAILGLSPWKTAYQVYQEKRKEVDDALELIFQEIAKEDMDDDDES